MTTPEEVFARALEDPKFRESILRKNKTTEFKEKFNVERATPLRCPACSQYGQAGGSLWRIRTEKNKFVCWRCERTWTVSWEDGDLDELILKIKEENRSKE